MGLGGIGRAGGGVAEWSKGVGWEAWGRSGVRLEEVRSTERTPGFRGIPLSA